MSIMKNLIFSTLLLISFCLISADTFAQHSVARKWNEATLDAIRNDFARPTVHARNLFHISLAMYECWAAYDEVAEQYMLGRDIHGFNTPFKEIPIPEDIKAAQQEAMSFAAFRIIFVERKFCSSRVISQELPEYSCMCSTEAPRQL